MFATSPEYQGHGCGSALLSFLSKVADADGVVSYLETAGIRNATFYAKKGGYNIVSKSECATFNADGGGVGMIRPYPCLSKVQSSKQGASMSKPAHVAP